jgi:hypothetical protein
MNRKSITQSLERWYSEYRIGNVPYWIRQNYLYQSLDILPKDLCTQEIIGESAEKRPIRLVTLGHGDIPVLLWTQMHGDEPTATRALLDIFSIIRNKKESELIKTILNNLTLYIIPMLNPDGAERFTRRTVLGIDMNRDALALATPEARILKSVHDRYKPQWGYSLHDQEQRYTVGGTGQAAGISLLSAANGWEISVTDIRRETMQLASCVAEYAQPILPGQIGRYDDSYEPRAFGENMHLWGTRNVLIESGYIPYDRQKDTIRKANAISILGSLFHLAGNTLPPDDAYHSLPINRRYFAEYLFKRASVTINGTSAGRQDVAFHLEHSPDIETHTVAFKLYLTELGDCSPYSASYTFDATVIQIRFEVDPSVPSGLPVTEEKATCEIEGADGRISVKEGIYSVEPEKIFGNLLV